MVEHVLTVAASSLLALMNVDLVTETDEDEVEDLGEELSDDEAVDSSLIRSLEYVVVDGGLFFFNEKYSVWS